MSIDISSISNPVSATSEYDPTAPGKWVDELSIFYLRMFKEVQVQNSGLLEDFSSLSVPLGALENTLSGRGEDGEPAFSTFFNAIDSISDAAFQGLKDSAPIAAAALPSVVVGGLPAIPEAAGFLAQLAVAVIKIILPSLIEKIIGRIIGGDKGSSSNEELVEVLKKAMLRGEGNLEDMDSILQELATLPLTISIARDGDLQDVVFNHP